jgi:hypothetical protein
MLAALAQAGCGVVQSGYGPSSRSKHHCTGSGLWDRMASTNVWTQKQNAAGILLGTEYGFTAPDTLPCRPVARKGPAAFKESRGTHQAAHTTSAGSVAEPYPRDTAEQKFHGGRTCQSSDKPWEVTSSCGPLASSWAGGLPSPPRKRTRSLPKVCNPSSTTKAKRTEPCCTVHRQMGPGETRASLRQLQGVHPGPERSISACSPRRSGISCR